MLKLKSSGSDPVKDLSQLSSVIGDEIYQEKNLSYTYLNTKYGEGIITAIRISNNITNLTFDFTLNHELEFSFDSSDTNSIDFLYCLEGSVFHKFMDVTSYDQINFRQNTIISRISNSKSVFKFPEHTPLKISLISYNPDMSIMDMSDKEISDLRAKALKNLTEAYLKNNYRYFGRVCFKTGEFVKNVFKYSMDSTSGILYKEAAVLNTIASQIDRHYEDTTGELSKAPIRQSEIDKVIALENFICNNLSEDLSIDKLITLSGLNAGKLQKGFQYLFDNTVSNYIKEKRLEKSAELIKETEMNVSELVYSIGFSSRSYFTKIFKERFGHLPSDCVNDPSLLPVV